MLCFPPFPNNPSPQRLYNYIRYVVVSQLNKSHISLSIQKTSDKILMTSVYLRKRYHSAAVSF